MKFYSKEIKDYLKEIIIGIIIAITACFVLWLIIPQKTDYEEKYNILEEDYLALKDNYDILKQDYLTAKNSFNYFSLKKYSDVISQNEPIFVIFEGLSDTEYEFIIKDTDHIIIDSNYSASTITDDTGKGSVKIQLKDKHKSGDYSIFIVSDYIEVELPLKIL